ncbi:unnamed protein product, partial [Rotaria sp. Silwood1]
MVGGIYCPLSVRDSQHRLSVLIEQIRSHLVLVHPITQTNFKDNIISLDIDSIVIDHERESDADVNQLTSTRVTPENMAYFIFASGVTGTPKAVGSRYHSRSKLSDNNGLFHYKGRKDHQVDASLLFANPSIRQFARIIEPLLIVYDDSSVKTTALKLEEDQDRPIPSLYFLSPYDVLLSLILRWLGAHVEDDVKFAEFQQILRFPSNLLNIERGVTTFGEANLAPLKLTKEGLCCLDEIHLGSHTNLGNWCTIMPATRLPPKVIVGSLTLITRKTASTENNCILLGIPAHQIPFVTSDDTSI